MIRPNRVLLFCGCCLTVLSFLSSENSDDKARNVIVDEWEHIHDDLVLDPNKETHLEIIGEIFWRHCSWRLSDAVLSDLRRNSEYCVPLLYNISMDRCKSSSLPLASVELWLLHSDVVILEDSSPEKTAEDLGLGGQKLGRGE